MSNRYCCLLAGGNEMEMQLAAGSNICLAYACCCMYSLELLMMDGKTVRNMWRVMQKYII
jgi:hypothetical protein